MAVALLLPVCSYLRLACSSVGAPIPRGSGPLSNASSSGAGRFAMALRDFRSTHGSRLRPGASVPASLGGVVLFIVT